MANPVPQSYANHTRWDPPFHFFALPVILLTVIAAIVHCVQRPSWFSAWLVLFSIAIVVLAVKSRFYALKAQDRIIRLEERERLLALLNVPLRNRIAELTEAQLVGLRLPTPKSQGWSKSRSETSYRRRT
jgi:hypothetical protein